MKSKGTDKTRTRPDSRIAKTANGKRTKPSRRLTVTRSDHISKFSHGIVKMNRQKRPKAKRFRDEPLATTNDPLRCARPPMPRIATHGNRINRCLCTAILTSCSFICSFIYISSLMPNRHAQRSLYPPADTLIQKDDDAPNQLRDGA